MSPIRRLPRTSPMLEINNRSTRSSCHSPVLEIESNSNNGLILISSWLARARALPNPALAFTGTAGGDPFTAGQTVRKAALD